MDIKKAFPSIDRTMLIDLLHRLGLPGPMVKAISSTFHLNTCRLKIEGHLSERFSVNLGVREGDIESPPLFNLVYGDILRSCDLDCFPDDAFEGSLLRVLGIAYADDLASFGLDVPLLQDSLDHIVRVMKPYNLLPNALKTQVLVFVTRRRLPPFSDFDPDQEFTLDGVVLESVTTFKYLGVHLDFLASSSPHEDICLLKAKAAAVQVGKLCRQLQITDLARLQTYFQSFVVSQFHGTQVVYFTNDCYESVLMLFFRTCFSLPIGYPRAILHYFTGPLEFFAQQLLARFKFFQKHAWKVGQIRDSFYQDRILFLLGQECWASDFAEIYEAFFQGSRFSEFDLFSPVDEFRTRLEAESIEHRNLRLTLMPSGILFRHLIPIGSLSSFMRELSIRSFEEVRLILLFFLRIC